MEKCILHVCAYAAPYPGNFIKTLLVLAKQNYKKGYKTIFAFPESASTIEWCKNLEKEYKIYYLPLQKARILPRTYKIMKDIYTTNNIVIAHSHFELYDIPVAVCSSRETKVFWHLHDALDLIYSKSNIFYRIIWRLQYSVFSKNVKLLSVSECGKRFACKLGFRQENAYFLPNGIDVDRIEVKDDLCKDIDYLIFGWDYYRKGVDILESLLERNFIDKKFVVIKDSETYEKTYSSGSKLKFHEPVKDVSKLYNRTNCFLHISRQEGLSYALLEAIYSGCLVVCSDIEQNLFAKEMPTVHFMKNGDIKSLEQCISKILNNEIQNSKADISKSRKIIKEKYSLETWTKMIGEFYFDEK